MSHLELRMTRLRLILLALLFLAPFVVLMGFGGYYLWEAGILWVWWPLLACMGLAYFLAWRWTRRRGLLPPTDIPPPGYWTDRDKIAWENVDAKAKSFEKVTLDQISTARHYTDLALDLATEVGTIYNPGLGRPVRHAHASRSAGLRRTRRRRPQRDGAEVRPRRPSDPLRGHQAGDRRHTAGTRPARTSTGPGPCSSTRSPPACATSPRARRLGSLLDRIQDNLILWFHTAFIHQLGRYLIELNSGRLKVGVKRYREILAAAPGAARVDRAGPSRPRDSGSTRSARPPSARPKPITLACSDR